MRRDSSDGRWSFLTLALVEETKDSRRQVVAPMRHRLAILANSLSGETPLLYRSAEQVVRKLTNIVANNGNMLLNVAPKGDGTIDERQRKIVEEIGAWLRVNGEAIFATRPWRIAKEGDCRFTRSKTGETLYVISLAWPADGKLTIQSLASHSEPIAEVSLLGYPGQLTWRQTDNGLVVNLPAGRPCKYAYSVKVKGC